MAEENATGFD